MDKRFPIINWESKFYHYDKHGAEGIYYRIFRKGVAFNDSESTDRPARSILTLKPLLTIDPKDKEKGVLEEHESEKKMTKSDFNAAQVARDEEIARQLEVELQAELDRERQREEQASMYYIANLYDEVQARI
nr:hypothetical protein [Tanacetum cinerariifolium]